MGLPVMDDHRQVQLLGEVELFPKPPELNLPRGEVVEEIEADLSDGDDLLLPRQDPERVIGRCIDLLHLVGMDADGRIDRLVETGQGHGLFTVGKRRSDRDDRRQAGLRGPRENRLPVVVECLHLQMGMGINRIIVHSINRRRCLLNTLLFLSAIRSSPSVINYLLLFG